MNRAEPLVLITGGAGFIAAIDLLSDAHSGRQDNDGAYAEFCIDARARTIHLEFNERFTSSELFTHDF